MRVLWKLQTTGTVVVFQPLCHCCLSPNQRPSQFPLGDFLDCPAGEQKLREGGITSRVSLGSPDRLWRSPLPIFVATVTPQATRQCGQVVFSGGEQPALFARNSFWKISLHNCIRNTENGFDFLVPLMSQCPHDFSWCLKGLRCVGRQPACADLLRILRFGHLQGTPTLVGTETSLLCAAGLAIQGVTRDMAPLLSMALKKTSL